MANEQTDRIRHKKTDDSLRIIRFLYLKKDFYILVSFFVS